jgi:hypothetical protein
MIAEGSTMPADIWDRESGHLTQVSHSSHRARGVRCDDPVVFPGYVTYCSFYDPFGNRLQMCSPPPAE